MSGLDHAPAGAGAGACGARVWARDSPLRRRLARFGCHSPHAPLGPTTTPRTTAAVSPRTTVAHLPRPVPSSTRPRGRAALTDQPGERLEADLIDLSSRLAAQRARGRVDHECRDPAATPPPSRRTTSIPTPMAFPTTITNPTVRWFVPVSRAWLPGTLSAARDKPRRPRPCAARVGRPKPSGRWPATQSTSRCHACRMALFRIESEKAVQILSVSSHPGKEKGLQKLIEASLEPLFGVRFVATEFTTGKKHRGRIDTLGLDQDGSPVIIEYKLKSNDNVINQGLFYLDWLMDHRGDFEIAARSSLDEAVEVTWHAPRLILLASSFSRYDQYAVNRIDERIELWTYKLYGENLLAVDLLSSEEVPNPGGNSPTPFKNPKKQNAATIPAKAVFDLPHHVAKMSPATQVLFELLREQLVDLGDDVTERFMNQYIGYRRRKNFCEVVGLRGKLNVFIDGPINNPDGIGDDVSQIGHWGTGDLRVSIESEDDLSAVLSLVEQAYALQE